MGRGGCCVRSAVAPVGGGMTVGAHTGGTRHYEVAYALQYVAGALPAPGFVDQDLDRIAQISSLSAARFLRSSTSANSSIGSILVSAR